MAFYQLSLTDITETVEAVQKIVHRNVIKFRKLVRCVFRNIFRHTTLKICVSESADSRKLGDLFLSQFHVLTAPSQAVGNIVDFIIIVIPE